MPPLCLALGLSLLPLCVPESGSHRLGWSALQSQGSTARAPSDLRLSRGCHRFRGCADAGLAGSHCAWLLLHGTRRPAEMADHQSAQQTAQTAECSECLCTSHGSSWQPLGCCCVRCVRYAHRETHSSLSTSAGTAWRVSRVPRACRSSKVKHARFTCRFMSSNEMSARSSCHHAVNIYCSSHGSNHLHTGASSLRRRCAVSCVGQACGSCCIAGTSMWSPRYQSCSMCYPHRVPHPGLPDTAESLLASVLAV